MGYRFYFLISLRLRRGDRFLAALGVWHGLFGNRFKVSLGASWIKLKMFSHVSDLFSFDYSLTMLLASFIDSFL